MNLYRVLINRQGIFVHRDIEADYVDIESGVASFYRYPVIVSPISPNLNTYQGLTVFQSTEDGDVYPITDHPGRELIAAFKDWVSVTLTEEEETDEGD